MQIKVHDLFFVRCFSYRAQKNVPCKQITSDTRKKKKTFFFFFQNASITLNEQICLNLSSYVLLYIFLADTDPWKAPNTEEKKIEKVTFILS